MGQKYRQTTPKIVSNPPEAGPAISSPRISENSNILLRLLLLHLDLIFVGLIFVLSLFFCVLIFCFAFFLIISAMPYISPEGTLGSISTILPAVKKSETQLSSSPPSPTEEDNWWTKAMDNLALRYSDEFKELTTNVWAGSKERGDLVKRAVTYLWADRYGL